jgi:multidrug resistance efflux pump
MGMLLRLDDAQARLQVAEAVVVVETARNQLASARELPEQNKARHERQRAAVEAAHHRLAAAQDLLGRKRLFLRVQQISAEEVTAAENRVKELEAAEHAEAAKLTELRAHDPTLDVHGAELAVAAAKSRLDQSRQAQAECVLKAPTAGSVLRILVGPGDVLQVPSKQAAILFAPNGPRLVRAEVDQEFAGRLATGQRALVEDDAPSGARWKGQVLRLADWYHQRRTILKEPSPAPDARTVECLITLDPEQPPLRLGQRVRVMIGGEPPG